MLFRIIIVTLHLGFHSGDSVGDDGDAIIIIFYCSTFPVLWFIHMKLPFWILWYFSKIFRHNFQRNWWKEFEEYYNFGFSRVSAKRVRMWIESSFLNSTKSFHHNSPPNGTNSRGSVSGPKIHFKDFGTKNVPLSVGSGCCKNRFSWGDLNNCGKTADACSLPCWLAEQRLQLWQFKICLSFLTHLIHRDSRSSRFSRRKSKVWKLKYAMAALHSSRTLARLLSLQVWSVPKGNIRLLLSWETLDYSHTHTFKVHNSHMKVLNIKHFHRHAQRLTVAYFQSLELLNVKR